MKNKDSRLAGMKKNPYANSPKNAIRNKELGKVKLRKKVSDIAKPIGLSPYQLRTHIEFMKIREGETHEQWEKRTRNRRLRSEGEVSSITKGKAKLKKITFHKRRSPRALQGVVLKKDFHFMKYYIFIINWASIKYNIQQRDLELGFHFYENIYFTRPQFQNKCLLFSVRSVSIFNRFLKSGYIRPFETIAGNEGVKRTTGYYKLSAKFVNILTVIYEKLYFKTEVDFIPTNRKSMHPDIENLIFQMAEEYKEIVLGKKEHENFNILKNY